MDSNAERQKERKERRENEYLGEDLNRYFMEENRNMDKKKKSQDAHHCESPGSQRHAGMKHSELALHIHRMAKQKVKCGPHIYSW